MSLSCCCQLPKDTQLTPESVAWMNWTTLARNIKRLSLINEGRNQNVD